MELENGIHWHKPDRLFESCQCKRMSVKGVCDRVQVLLPASFGSKKHPRAFDGHGGAVISGRRRRFPWRWPSKGEPVEGGLSDSEPDDESSFRDSGVGESNPSTAEFDSSGKLDSSPSSYSGPTSTTGEAMMSGGIWSDEEVHAAAQVLEHMNPTEPVVVGEPTQHIELNSTSDRGSFVEMGSSGAKMNDLMPLDGNGIIPSTAQTFPEVPIRPGGAKRTWDKVKEITPQIFLRKRRKESVPARDVHSGGSQRAET
jgi:hypothetical protein